MNTAVVKIAVTVVLIGAGIVNVSGLADKKSTQYVQASINRSLSAFALARSLNAVISVAQGTEISVEPMGMGLTFTPGEILDPVNDLIERFSWVMLASATSFGIQKIMLKISAWPGSKWLLSAVLAMTVLLLYIRKTPLRMQVVLLKISFILVFIRFCMPAVFILNERLYTQFMQNQYQASTALILKHQMGIQQLSAELNTKADQSTSTVDRLMQIFDAQHLLKDKMQRLQQKTIELANQLAIAMIDLMVVFILQTVLLPSGLLYCLYRIVVLICKQNLVDQMLND